jgi:ribosomal protein L11 methyltransferase
VDIDEIAVRVTQENLERNGYPAQQVSTLTLLESSQAEAVIGSADANGGRLWDIVAANILANTLIELMPDLAAALAPNGQLILSGLLLEQEAKVVAAATAYRLHQVERRVEGDWLALRVQPET